MWGLGNMATVAAVTVAVTSAGKMGSRGIRFISFLEISLHEQRSFSIEENALDSVSLNDKKSQDVKESKIAKERRNNDNSEIIDCSLSFAHAFEYHFIVYGKDFDFCMPHRR